MWTETTATSLRVNFGHKFEIRSQLHNAHHPKSIGDKTIIDLNFKVTILIMGYTLLYSCFPQYFPPMSFVDTIHWIVIIIAEVCSSWLLGSLIISHLKRVRYYHYWLFEHKVILFSCRFRSSHYTVLCTFHLNKSQSSELDVIKGATTAELLLAYKMLKEEFQLAEMRFVQNSMQAFNANWICINSTVNIELNRRNTFIRLLFLGQNFRIVLKRAQLLANIRDNKYRIYVDGISSEAEVVSVPLSLLRQRTAHMAIQNALFIPFDNDYIIIYTSSIERNAKVFICLSMPNCFVLFSFVRRAGQSLHECPLFDSISIYCYPDFGRKTMRLFRPCTKLLYTHTRRAAHV